MTYAADIVEPVRVEYRAVDICSVEFITALFIKELVVDSVEPDKVE